MVKWSPTKGEFVERRRGGEPRVSDVERRRVFQAESWGPNMSNRDIGYGVPKPKGTGKVIPTPRIGPSAEVREARRTNAASGRTPGANKQPNIARKNSQAAKKVNDANAYGRTAAPLRRKVTGPVDNWGKPLPKSKTSVKKRR